MDMVLPRNENEDLFTNQNKVCVAYNVTSPTHLRAFSSNTMLNLVFLLIGICLLMVFLLSVVPSSKFMLL